MTSPILSESTDIEAQNVKNAKPPSHTTTTESTRRASAPAVDVAHQLHDQTLRLSFPRLIAAYLCLCACYFISYLDMNSTTTALPTISNALQAGTTVTWAGTAYLLGQTTFQPLYGHVSDIAGRKPILLASLACIIIGDLLCGWAQNPLWLYVCRALSGISGGGISSLVAIIVSDLVSLKDRGKYQGMISIAIGTGAMTGPFVAASLVRKGPDGWRWVFWVPSILAFTCFLVLLFLLPLKPVTGSWKDKVRKIDWMGVGASVTGIVLVLVSIHVPTEFFSKAHTTPADPSQLRWKYMAMAQCAGHFAVDYRQFLSGAVRFAPRIGGQDPHHGIAPVQTTIPNHHAGLWRSS